VKKPAHQWQTRRALAIRRDAPPSQLAGDARAEAFDLHDAAGARVGEAVLGLDRQIVDEAAAADPDLLHAVRAWLAARGRFVTALATTGGLILDAASFQLDALGDPPGAPAARIVTLAPSNAEVVDALGVFDRVIACEDSSDRPAAVANLERLGPDLGPDLDRVAELRPDLVVSSLSVPGMERVVTGLRARGVPQVVLAPRRIADVLEDLRRVGAHLGVQGAAAEVVADLEAQIEALKRQRVDPPVRVYLEWWPRPMFTPGAETYADELIALAGGVNVFGDRPGASVRIEPAELVAAAPDLCFVSWCGVAEAKLDPENLCARPGLQALPAATSGRVYALDEALSGRPGPHVLEAARRMAERIRAFRGGTA
jgi:iron complex transport system substrate-binding protein